MRDSREVQLKTGIAVPRTLPYKLRAELLVRDAIVHKEGRRANGWDNKSLVEVGGIESLIGAGAEIKSLNVKQVDNGIYHEVVYQGYQFIATSQEPAAFVIEHVLAG